MLSDIQQWFYSKQSSSQLHCVPLLLTQFEVLLSGLCWYVASQVRPGFGSAIDEVTTVKKP